MKAVDDRVCAIPALHADILVHIFRLLNDAHDVDWVDFATNGLPMRWLRITWVCREWRAIALGYPTLWSCIDMNRPEISEQMVGLTRGVPLRLFFDGRPFKPLSNTLWAKTMEEIERIQDIYIVSAIGEDVFEALATSVTTPASSLCSLRISLDPYLDEDERYRSMQFLSRSMPKLRHLELRGFCYVPVHKYPNLNTLVLATHDGYHLLMTAWDLLNLLKGVPRLRKLVLQNLQLEGSDEFTSVPTELPELESLTISSRDSNTLLILDYIRYPPRANISLNCTSDDPVDISTLSRVSSLRSSANPNPLILVAYLGSPNVFYMKASYNKPTTDFCEISVGCPGNPETSYLSLEASRQICEHFRPTKTLCFIVTGMQDVIRMEWCEFFESFGKDYSLAVLCVHPATFCAIIHACNMLPPTGRLRHLSFASKGPEASSAIDDEREKNDLVDCILEIRQPTTPIMISFGSASLGLGVVADLDEKLRSLGDVLGWSQEANGSVTLYFPSSLLSKTLPDVNQSAILPD